MALSGPEIQAALTRFVDRWQEYSGSEIGEAQTFLNELFACYGSDRLAVGAKFEDFRTSAGFMDLHWPTVCIVEMKAPGVPIETARDQVHRYWHESADHGEDRPAARWVLICNFAELEIWEPGRFPGRPRIRLALEDLPRRYDVLNFLTGPHVEPSFTEHDRELTKDAAQRVARVYQSLSDRAAAPAQEIQRFVMQSVWCMFAEDLGMLHGWPFEKLIENLITAPDRSSASALGYFFRLLNQKTDRNRVGEFSDTTYVNGELFAEPAEVHLDAAELRMLREAAGYDWSQVDPTIFGSLMEGVLGERRWELGAHYTYETDIMKIVGPTIVSPWMDRIEAVESVREAVVLLDELCAFRVLDPACGCGNFLYIAYRELRALEALLKQRIADLSRAAGLPTPGDLPFVPLANMQGIEIEPASALIARVTLWMGHRQMIDVYGPAEDPLPLVTLSSIRVADALKVDWPETDCIIGNPPFLGAKHLRAQHGDAYVDWLAQTFKIGVKDYCVYWFRLAHEHLQAGQRAGLVGTNSVSQTSGRAASLEYIVALGGHITDAVSTQKWPGEAKVHVSLVNWIKGDFNGLRTLDGKAASHISGALRDEPTLPIAVLAANGDKAFAGVVPQAKGFIVSAQQATMLQAAGERDVVARFLNGDDIANSIGSAPGRWIIDFRSRALEEAGRFPKALRIVREGVRAERESSSNRKVETRWWLFGRRVEGMRAAVDRLDRFVAAGSTGKRFLAAWQDASVLANNAVCVFAFEDDFSMAVLQSRAHIAWAWHHASTLKGDLRYTPTSVFMTFPWPDRATEDQRDRAADVCRRLLAHRAEICERDQIGLTKLYNAMDDGAYVELKDLHRELDEAVAACYDWPARAAQDDAELIAWLSDLNRQIAEGERDYDPWG